MFFKFGDGDMPTEPGVVNALEPHPYMPYLATSGLEHNVKLWSPSGVPFLCGPHKDIQIARKVAASNR